MVYFLLSDSVASGEAAARPNRRVGGPRMVSEDQFLAYCQLDLQKGEDHCVYEAIKNEADHGLQRLYVRMLGNHARVNDGSRDITQASETDIQEEVVYIAANAGPDTSLIYALLPGSDGSNWIIRWLLFDAARRFEIAHSNTQPEGFS